MILEIYEACVLEAIENGLCGGLLGRCIAGEEGGEVDELEL